MAEIDRDSPLYPYEQIARWLVEEIRRRGLGPHAPLPSEKSIGQEFPDVARTTIRRAIRRLREDGVVYTVPQRGSYVSPPNGDQ